MINITIDEFKKIDLRIAKIISAVKVEGSDKLLKLEVDLGGESKQIISGIGKKYDAGSLAGRKIIIVANLESRKLMGLESQGMLLAASGPEGPVILAPESDVAEGTVIR